VSAVSLGGAIVSLSVSPPHDLGRLGYLRREFDGLVFELALHVIRQGGRVLYGGHLQPGGTTALIFEHLAAAYASGAAVRSPDRPRPVLNLLAATELRKTPFARLAETLAAVQGFVELRVVLSAGRCLRAYVRDDGNPGGPALSLAEPGRTPVRLTDQKALDEFTASNVTLDEAAALSAMRGTASTLERARVVAGGRRGDLGASASTAPGQSDRFGGTMPGIYEEIIGSLPRTPVAILAAYGGAAREAAFDLGLLGEIDLRAPYLGQQQEGLAAARIILRKTWLALPRARRTEQRKLAAFARRDDAPLLARDLVRTIASIISRQSPPDLNDAAHP
jgi:hypothetical protein